MVNSLGAIERNDYAITNGDATFSSIYQPGYNIHYPYVEALTIFLYLPFQKNMWMASKWMDGIITIKVE